MTTQKGIVNFTGKLGEVVGRKMNSKFTLSRPRRFTSKKLKERTLKEYLLITQIIQELGSRSHAVHAFYQVIVNTYSGNKTPYKYQRLTGAFY